MNCNGVRLWPLRAPDGSIAGWDYEDAEIENTGCEDCEGCTIHVMLNDPDFPTLTCEGDGCQVVTRGDTTVGPLVEAWCCKD